MLDNRERARQQAQDERRDAAASARRAREVEQARKKSVREARRRNLAEVTGSAKSLERHYQRTTTRPGEQSAAILRDLGVLYYAAPAAAPPPTGMMERVARAVAGPPAGRWHVHGHPAVSFIHKELTRWGAGTRAAIRPVLADLHAREDQLRAELGRVPRKDRPDLHH